MLDGLLTYIISFCIMFACYGSILLANENNYHLYISKTRNKKENLENSREYQDYV